MEKYAELFKLFNELYERGLIGIQNNNVQIDNSTFAKLCADAQIKIEKHLSNRLELTAVVNGVPFQTLIGGK